MSKNTRMWGKGDVTRQAREFGTTASIITTTTAPALSPEAKQANIDRRRDMREITYIESTLREYLTDEEYRDYEYRAYGERGTNRRVVVLREARQTLADLKLPEPEEEDYTGSAEYSELPY